MLTFIELASLPCQCHITCFAVCKFPVHHFITIYGENGSRPKRPVYLSNNFRLYQ